MEWLQANWLWVVLGLAAVWFLLGRRGTGCGMGGHDHGGMRGREYGSHHGGDERGETKPSATGRRHGGCC
jgi:hypothetical protein